MLALLVPGVGMGGGGVVTPDQPTGGWPFLSTYERELSRRREEEVKRREIEEESEHIQDALDRDIAILLRKQEAEDAKKAEMARLLALAKQNADLQAAREYSERVARAFERAVKRGNFSALEALDRELKRAQEEEEFLLIAILASI